MEVPTSYHMASSAFSMALTNSHLFSIVLLIVIFSVGMYFAESQFRQRKPWIYSYGLLPSLYFLGLSSLIIYFFISAQVIQQPTSYLAVTITFFAVVYATSAIFYYVARIYLAPPAYLLKEKPFYIWLSLDYSYIPFKLSNIFFQQSVVLALVFRISEYFSNAWIIGLFFGLAFGIAHLGMFLYESKRWALYYIVPSFLSGMIFPYFLSYTQYGFLYNIAIHWGFYLFSGLGIWVLYNFQQKISKT